MYRHIPTWYRHVPTNNNKCWHDGPCWFWWVLYWGGPYCRGSKTDQNGPKGLQLKIMCQDPILFRECIPYHVNDTSWIIKLYELSHQPKIRWDSSIHRTGFGCQKFGSRFYPPWETERLKLGKSHRCRKGGLPWYIHMSLCGIIFSHRLWSLKNVD